LTQEYSNEVIDTSRALLFLSRTTLRRWGFLIFAQLFLSRKNKSEGKPMKKNMFFLTSFVGIVLLLLSISAPNTRADYKYNYIDFSEMVTLLEDLESQSSLLDPDVYSLQIIGYSYQGNPIYAVKFSDNPELEEDSEPDVVFDSGIHAREWLPVESNINFIQYLFDVYYDDLHADHAEVVDLVDNSEIWILPMLNPDGRIRDDVSGGDPESFWTDTSYHDGDDDGWRMNLQEVPCPSRPGGTNQGIDLNRNWSFRFSEGSDCTEIRYNGGSPLSTPETQVLKEFINNHMVSLLFHQHSAIGYLFTNSGEVGLGAYLGDEMAVVYEAEGLPDLLLELGVLHGGGTYTPPPDPPTLCDGNAQTGQYYNWLWYPIACPLAPDVLSRRTIQCVFYEYPVGSNNYGHPSEGKIGQYNPGDASNYFHPSSGDTVDWIIARSVEMNKYFIKQAHYPFSPRYHTDMSRKPEAPDTDVAVVGAKISEVGTGLPGCFTSDSNGRDLIDPGSKRVTWNVQNNGTGLRTIDSEITICNHTDDPACASPVTDVLIRVDVSPEAIETFTYDYDFPDLGACKDYSVTLSTGESNVYDNDVKVFVFTVTPVDDTDCDDIPESEDNCPNDYNPSQTDCDTDTTGDACDVDTIDTDGDGVDDGEGVGHGCDNCPNDYNPQQEDTFPPQGNDIGDVCDCEADFNCDGNVDATDVTAFLVDFGRSTFFNPCVNANPCNGDFDCNVNVDANDVTKFLEDFGRSQFFNPCPACVAGTWCIY
jgi:hypothetical protein